MKRTGTWPHHSRRVPTLWLATKDGQLAKFPPYLPTELPPVPFKVASDCHQFQSDAY